MASPPATNAASADTSSPSAGGPPIPSDLPELTTTTATDPTDRIAAVRLIADSVAQQRQTAARTLITHPLPLSLHILLLSLLSARLYRTPSDLPLLFTTAAGATMAALVAARWLVAGYIAAAEAISPAGWLADADAVIVTKWGRNIIGAVVLGFSPAPASPPSSPGSGGRRRNRHGGSGGGGGGAAGERALVRAWTVQRKYRGQGVGGALLDEAVRVARARGGKNREGEVLEFAEEHASEFRPGHISSSVSPSLRYKGVAEIGYEAMLTRGFRFRASSPHEACRLQRRVGPPRRQGDCGTGQAGRGCEEGRVAYVGAEAVKSCAGLCDLVLSGRRQAIE